MSGKIRGAFVEVPYFLERCDPDALRFYLTTTAPETRNTEPALSTAEGFSWEDFVERNNNELIRSFGSSVPPWGPLKR